MKPLRKRQIFGQAVVDLIDRSQREWGREEIRERFGLTQDQVSSVLQNLVSTGRIRRMRHGVYANARMKKKPEIVTDEMLKKYGFNL